MIAVAVLAAGRARRMGCPKLLLEVGGMPMVRRVAGEALAAPADETVVVVSSESFRAIAAALEGLAVRFVVNERAEEGLGTSIAAAASSVAPSAEAMLLVQADQPRVDRSMLAALIDEWKRTGASFVASSYGSVVTTPVLFSRALFGELRALGGDRGARRVLERHASDGRVLAFPAERGHDVDTPEDYRRLGESPATRTTPSGVRSQPNG